MSNFVQNAIAAFKQSNGNDLTPTQQEYINTIESGDASKGEQLAMNLCKSMGLSKEQAYQQAVNFFSRGSNPFSRN